MTAATASADALNALGNPVRQQILQLLLRQPRPVSDIAKELPVSRPAVSKHLRILQDAHLVRFRTEGTRHVFELETEGFEAAREWLDQFWDDALSRFKMVAENVSENEKTNA